MPFVLLALLIGFLRFGPLLDPDLGWHLYLGKEMVLSGHLINNLVGYNIFQNYQLIDHEWLSNIAIYFVYNKFGYFALSILFGGIVLLSLFLLYKNIRKISGSAFFASLFTLITLFTLNYFLHGVRLQYLLYLLAALIPFIRTFVSSYRYRVFFYFLLFALFNNLHGGTIVFIIVPFLLEFDSLSAWKKGFVALVITILATMINPYSFRFFSLIGSYIENGSYRQGIAEWLPLYNHPLGITGPATVLLFFVFLFMVNSFWKKVPTNKLILILVFMIIGIQFRRFLPFFVIFASPYAALSLKAMANDFSVSARTKTLVLLGFTSMLILLLPASEINFSSISKNPFDYDKDYPLKTSEYIRQNPIKGNLFNEYRFGGYLLWQGNGQIKVFIDGRGPQAQVRDTTLLDEYNSFFATDENIIKASIQRDQINSFLIANKEEGSRRNLITFLKKDGWSIKYQDDIAILYVKE